ncbi:Fibronectin type-III domain-containing protein 3a [Armadillidium vulgare]|nr:Fibronectin type-III domain-containing protein 3a [Armadillidium vulgare]
MHSSNPIHNTPPLSPKKETVLLRKPDEETLNGEMSAEGTQVQLQELLSTIKPEVRGIGPYCADVHWTIPDLSNLSSEKGITESSLQFEVFLNGCSYDKVTDTNLALTNLRPGTEYKLYIVCFCNGIRAYQTAKQSFSTKPTVPDPPQPPRLVDRKKQSLLLKWNAPKENGAKILHYSLEMKGGHLNTWTEIYRNKNKEFLITKLRPQTSYRFRLLANNEVGNSEYSPEIIATTVGLAPTQPNPPCLEETTVHSLKLSWQQRSSDESFSLEMDDSCNEYGFMPVFSGSETSFTCHNLRRNSDYRFRLCAQNINGKSPYSEIACYRTVPDIPQPPSVPMMKGKHLSDRLCLTWSPPRDHGGIPVSNYLLQIDKGSGFETIYYGPVTECEVTSLSAGSTYRFRCLAESVGGKSKWSAEALLTTKPVVPGPCKPPRLLAKPKAHTLQLKWGYPEYEGGASVTEFQMDMITPDTERRQVYCGRDLECTVASLLPGRAYMFLLRASNRIGGGPWSEPYEVVSGAGAPDSPKPPLLACKGPHVVVVTWDEPINNGASIEQYVVNMAEFKSFSTLPSTLQWFQRDSLIVLLQVSCPNTESSESSSTCGDLESELTYVTAYTGSMSHAEIKNLAPATTYAFKVCASNVAGAGPFSSSASVTTPAAPPACVAHITSSPEATEATLYWTEPACHGDPISHYNIEIGERTVSTPGPVLEFTVDQLLPETMYKLRIQAVNSVGPSPFSGVHKLTTQPLPPPPPRIELVKASFNSLRLKWGEGRNPELLKYCLQMECYNPHTKISEFYQIYSGTNHSFKVGKLEENSTYRLRICASNEAGLGPFSDPLEFTTTKAPPPPIKAPRISEGDDKSYCVEWCGVRCPGEDHIIYRLQVLQSGKDQDYSLVYVGSESSYTLKDLKPQTGYYVRVCGVRMCGDKEVVAGAYSSPTLFNTPKIEEVETPVGPTCTAKKQSLEWHLLTDHQKALAILALFSLLAFVAAYVLSPSPQA